MTEVVAAGGVVWRPVGTDVGAVEVAVIWRDRRADWSLPKGKVEGSETPLETALREVHEETGLVVSAGPSLGQVRYRLPDGRSKVVWWWSLRYEAGTFTANDEACRLRWLPLADAQGAVTHDTDRAVLHRFEVAAPWSP